MARLADRLEPLGTDDRDRYPRPWSHRAVGGREGQEETVDIDALGQLNWLAVIVAALAYFALGAVWYMPFAFGRPWQSSVGWDETKQAGASSLTYAAPALFALVSSVATAMLANATASTDVGSGLALGLVVGIGFGLALAAYEAVFDPNKPRPWVWFAISGAYHLVGLVIVAVIVSAWR